MKPTDNVMQQVKLIENMGAILDQRANSAITCRRRVLIPSKSFLNQLTRAERRSLKRALEEKWWYMDQEESFIVIKNGHPGALSNADDVVLFDLEPSDQLLLEFMDAAQKRLESAGILMKDVFVVLQFVHN